MASAVYPTLRGTLLGWALNGNGPADAVLKVSGVSSAYAYSATHSSTADLTGVLFTSDALTGTISPTGVIDAADPTIDPVTPGPTLDALVVFMEYTGGSTLVCYIDESTDASLPMTLVNTTFGIRFNENGICQI